MIKIDLIDEVVWSYLPVMKIVKYPAAQGGFKPFAQSQICYKDGEGLLIKMWAFEVAPLSLINKEIFNDSLLMTVIGNKLDDSFKGISLSFNKNGNYYIENYFKGSSEIILDDININIFTGEDLQGIYWGGEFIINNYILNKYLDLKISNKEDFYINFIKCCYDKNYFHCGGFLNVKENYYDNLEKVIIR